MNKKTLKQVTSTTLQEIYRTSSINVIEQIPSKDKRLENCLGYFDPNVPEILIRKDLPNEQKIYIFYHEYKHYLQNQRYTEFYIDSHQDEMEYWAEIYAAKMLLKIKAMASLELWRDSVYNWRDDGENGDKCEYLSEVAEKIIQHSIWLKVANFLNCPYMVECRRMYDGVLSEEELDKMYEKDEI